MINWNNRISYDNYKGTLPLRTLNNGTLLPFDLAKQKRAASNFTRFVNLGDNRNSNN